MAHFWSFECFRLELFLWWFSCSLCCHHHGCCCCCCCQNLFLHTHTHTNLTEIEPIVFLALPESNQFGCLFLKKEGRQYKAIELLDDTENLAFSSFRFNTLSPFCHCRFVARTVLRLVGHSRPPRMFSSLSLTFGARRSQETFVKGCRKLMRRWVGRFMFVGCLRFMCARNQLFHTWQCGSYFLDTRVRGGFGKRKGGWELGGNNMPVAHVPLQDAARGGNEEWEVAIVPALRAPYPDICDTSLRRLRKLLPTKARMWPQHFTVLLKVRAQACRSPMTTSTNQVGLAELWLAEDRNLNPPTRHPYAFEGQLSAFNCGGNPASIMRFSWWQCVRLHKSCRSLFLKPQNGLHEKPISKEVFLPFWPWKLLLVSVPTWLLWRWTTVLWSSFWGPLPPQSETSLRMESKSCHVYDESIQLPCNGGRVIWHVVGNKSRAKPISCESMSREGGIVNPTLEVHWHYLHNWYVVSCHLPHGIQLNLAAPTIPVASYSKPLWLRRVQLASHMRHCKKGRILDAGRNMGSLSAISNCQRDNRLNRRLRMPQEPNRNERPEPSEPSLRRKSRIGTASTCFSWVM